MIGLTVGLCLSGSLYRGGLRRRLGLELGLLLAAAVFCVAPLLLDAVCVCLNFFPVGGILARTAILIVDLLPANALGLGLGVGTCRSFLLALRLSPQSVAPSPLYSDVRVISEESGCHNALFNQEPNAARGHAQD
ncbi:MAG TPA: hypothetical protein VGM09_10240 [Bradyrhizobium sp.]